MHTFFNSCSNRFKYQYRLHHRWQFKHFFNQSEIFRFSECTIFRIKNDLNHFRLGITLKAKGSSVERNRVKRQIRESFRKVGSVLGSFDYNVVIPAGKKMAHPFAKNLGLQLRKGLSDEIKGR